MFPFSIITPVLNRAETVDDCLGSVAGQAVPLEHIIVDGGSTDGTTDAIQAYAERENQRDERRVVFTSEPDEGIYDAINKGLDIAEGDVVGILNADDAYAHNEVLQRVEEKMTESNGDCCYGDLDYVDSAFAGKVVRHWPAGPFAVHRLRWGWMPPHPTFFLRREWYEQYGGYRLDLGSAADYELMLRMLLRYEAKPAYVPETLVRMRVGGASNRNLCARLRANQMDRQAWKVNGLKPYPWTLWLKPLRKLGQFVVRRGR